MTRGYAVPGGSVELLRPRLRFYRWRATPFMPVEFSAAAFRFGHSIVRPSYLINGVARTEPRVERAHRIPLFGQETGPRQNLRGHRPVPDDWAVQWEFFLPRITGALEDAALPQPTYKLDAQLAHPLGQLDAITAAPEPLDPDEPESLAQNLAVRNLLRGRTLGVPGGQDVARAMGIEPLGEAQLYDKLELGNGVLADLRGAAPLWFYVLREAELCGHGERLGPLGARIVAEVLIGLLAADPLSFLSVAPGWTPTLPYAGPDFTLSDLINFPR